MYANLRVVVDGGRETIMAHKVTLTGGILAVYEDLNDGDGNYAVEGPKHLLAPEDDIVITADF